MSRKSLTLLEIVIVMALIGLMGVFGLGGVRSLIDRYQFLSDGQRCFDLVRELQLQALTLESDIEVCFYRDRYWIMEPSSAEAVVMKGKIVMKSVEHVLIDDIAHQKYVFTIFSSGRIEPRVSVTLVGTRHNFFIDMRRPLLIKQSMVNR